MTAGGKILLVDDDAAIRELASVYLVKEGFDVSCAADGVAGVEKAKELQPALIVLDVMMPGMTGFEFCKSVRLDSNVPIIMLTARDDDIDKIVGLEIGADDYL